MPVPRGRSLGALSVGADLPGVSAGGGGSESSASLVGRLSDAAVTALLTWAC